jgi:hypothetical protein
MPEKCCVYVLRSCLVGRDTTQTRSGEEHIHMRIYVIGGEGFRGTWRGWFRFRFRKWQITDTRGEFVRKQRRKGEEGGILEAGGTNTGKVKKRNQG